MGAAAVKLKRIVIVKCPKDLCLIILFPKVYEAFV